MNNTANKTGKRLENSVEEIIRDKDFIFVDNKKYFGLKKSTSKKIYTKQLKVGKTIYDTDRKCDFITFNPKNSKEIVVECKWQDVKGSVDEKYPFLVLNIKAIGIKTIIILDGNGYKPKAKEWLKEQEDDCLIKVANLAEFSRESRRGLI